MINLVLAKNEGWKGEMEWNAKHNSELATHKEIRYSVGKRVSVNPVGELGLGGAVEYLQLMRWGRKKRLNEVMSRLS